MTTAPPQDGTADAPRRRSSSVRTPRDPLLPRKVWILGAPENRLKAVKDALEAAGHQVRSAETGAELASTLRDFRPEIIVIDMQDDPDRGRHVATQLRADRATRQLPIILAGARDVDMKQSDKPITGPTRRYVLPLDAPSVLNAIVTEL
jgi:PleD family two-component response regulator